MALRTTDAVVRVSARTGRVNQIANPSSASVLVDDLDASRELVPGNRSAELHPRLPGDVVDTGQVDVAAAEQLTEERRPVHVAHRRALVGADPIDHEAGRVALPLRHRSMVLVALVLVSTSLTRSSPYALPPFSTRSLRSQISRHAMGTPAAGS